LITSIPQLRVEGLARFDYAELEDSLPSGAVIGSEEERFTDEDYGEVGLITAVILLSAATINAVSKWLERRHKEDSHTEFTLSANFDGSVTLRVGSSDVPHPAPVAEAIRTAIEHAVETAGG
jgi:hypothetical protein